MTKRHYFFFVTILVICQMGSSTSVFAKDEYGKVWLNGTIVEGSCNIGLEDPDQIIDMGITPISDLYRGNGPEKEFEIKFLDCAILNPSDNFQFIRASFNGKAINNHFAVNGNAKGVALELKYIGNDLNTEGKLIAPGAINQYQLNRKLIFSFKLFPNGQPLLAGDYETLLQFNINYN